MSDYPFDEIDETSLSDKTPESQAGEEESPFSFDWMIEPADLLESDAASSSGPTAATSFDAERLMPLWAEEQSVDPYAHLDEPLMPFTGEDDFDSPKWLLPPSQLESNDTSRTDSLEFPIDAKDSSTFAEPFTPETFVPETVEENVRRSGLAWSAGIVFFSSTAFTLLIGWFGDLLLGTSPWGLVGGIILGSIIGFIQFFRITSRIFKPSSSKPEIQPLMNVPDE